MADPTLYLYTSLTAGSSHIITATSRMETILKANRIPFRAIDCATDEKARQLWSRRSKGKKIPGLVKYGQIIGDLEQVEEWNEFGELVDQIEDVSDIFGDTPMTDTPMAPPVNTIPPSLLRPVVEKPAGVSQPMSRSSSETKHISISEPAEKKAKADAGSTKGTKEEFSMATAMRDLGAAAAAKAGQMKAAAAAKAAQTSSTTKDTPIAAPTSESSAAAASVPTPKKIDPSETTPNPAQIKSSPDATLESTSEEEKQSITAGKTPAQLTAEGVRRESVEKVSPLAETAAAADTSDVPPVDNTSDTTKSTEEQVLDLRRSSSVAKAKSGLSKETSIDDISSEDEDEVDNETAHRKAAAQAMANVQREKAQEAEAAKKAAPIPAEDKIEEEDEDEDENEGEDEDDDDDKDEDEDVNEKDKVKGDKIDRSTKTEEASSKVTSSVATESSVVSTDDVSVSASGPRPDPPKMHRGSSLSEAPDDEIKEIEKRNAILEEDGEDEDDDENDDEEEEEEDKKDEQKVVKTETEVAGKASTPTTSTTTETPSKATSADEDTQEKDEDTMKTEVDPQTTKAAEPKDAAKSVGD